VPSFAQSLSSKMSKPERRVNPKFISGLVSCRHCQATSLALKPWTVVGLEVAGIHFVHLDHRMSAEEIEVQYQFVGRCNRTGWHRHSTRCWAEVERNTVAQAGCNCCCSRVARYWYRYQDERPNLCRRRAGDRLCGGGALLSN
jgi:hypothetical protein